MKLVSVESAAHTAFANAIDLMLTADIGDGAGNQSLPYTWIAGDPHGLGPQIDAFMAANPAFPIGPYVAPVVDFSAIDLATINDALAQPGSITRALALVLLQRINAIDGAINALNTKTALAGNNLPIFTQSQLVAALQAQIR